MSIDIEEGNMEILDLEVLNCGNTWMAYDLSIDGISRAGSKGIQVDSETLVPMELYYQTSEVLEVQIYVDDIRQDTSMALEFRLKDHETSEEFCRMSVMINAFAEDEPQQPPSGGDGKVVPGDDDDPPITSDDDDDVPVDDTVIDGGPSEPILGIWMVVPILLIFLGVGAYIFVVVRKK
jgi:hypothetical protein